MAALKNKQTNKQHCHLAMRKFIKSKKDAPIQPRRAHRQKPTTQRPYGDAPLLLCSRTFFFLPSLLALAAGCSSSTLTLFPPLPAAAMDTAVASAQRRRQRPSWLPWARRQAAAYLAAAGGGDDGWAASAVSAVRVVVCFLAMAITTAARAVIMLLLLPWPSQRIRQSNVYGHVTGRMLLWILGNPIKVEGAEHLKTRGIFICNHASPLDIFLVMCLAPTGTVGIAKKEIIWYPLFGQLYVLANHLRIDRSNPAAAIHSMKQVARAVVKNNLSLILFPEGTRSKNGRLLPFKKGFVHAALQTGLPVVPIVVTGTHQAWRNNSVRVRPVPLTVKVLPPIGTAGWEEARAGEHAEAVRSLYACNLPDSQKPLDAPLATQKSD